MLIREKKNQTLKRICKKAVSHEFANEAAKQCLHVNEVPWSYALFLSLQTPPVSFWSLFDGRAVWEGHTTNNFHLLCKQRPKLADGELTVFSPPSPAPCGKWPGPGILECASGGVSGSACVCTPYPERYVHCGWSGGNGRVSGGQSLWSFFHL